MLSQRAVQTSMRRLAAQQSGRLGVTKFAPAAGSAMVQRRGAISDNKLSTEGSAYADEATDTILINQRKNRPVSPHLGIYKPQITWYPSMFNRITGVALSGLVYLFFPAYLAAPLLGWHLESASLAAAFGALPLLAKVGLKSLIALPFTFHSLNGIRHLGWDLGLGINNAQVARTGWAVVGLSFVTAGALALFV